MSTNLEKVEQFYEKIKIAPGGLGYFQEWIKYYGEEKEFWKVNVIRNYFDKKVEERTELNELAASIFLKHAQTYVDQYLPKVATEMESVKGMQARLKKRYLRLKKHAGGYYAYYGWIRQQHPEVIGQNESTVRNLIYRDYDRKYILDYQKRTEQFLSLTDEYIALIKSNANTFVSEIHNIPPEVLTSFHQYFLFFSEYLERTTSKSVNFNVLRIDSGLRFQIVTTSPNEIKEIKKSLDEYVAMARHVLLEGGSISDILDKLNILETSKLRLETELKHLETNLKIVELENKHLKSTTEFLKKLSLTMASQGTSITNQMITDGHQQFADSIENNQQSK